MVLTMNNKWYVALVLSLLPLGLACANCDLSGFRWDCDLPVNVQQQSNAHSLIYCGKFFGYVSQEEYNTIKRYQRANVNMVVTINGEYVDSPCIAAER